jgi:hypothetical protein
MLWLVRYNTNGGWVDVWVFGEWAVIPWGRERNVR